MQEQQPFHFSYPAMGTQWAVTVWDHVQKKNLLALQEEVIRQTRLFDATYSRFTSASLISSLVARRGRVRVPSDLVQMLRLYSRLYDHSCGKCNPLIGCTLSDMGYDAQYSLAPKQHIRTAPDFHDALTIVDDETIDLHQEVSIDLGALGKGYFVDVLSAFLANQGVERFLVNGSGDIYYRGAGVPIRCGLEHPGDASKAIGVLTLTEGAFCASAGNRRRWATYHHTIDPQTLVSPQTILATWTVARNAALADGLSTCLFLVEPERFTHAFPFEYCILSDRYTVNRSAGFTAELF